MKNLKFIVAAGVALFFATSAFAADVTFSGGAAARFGVKIVTPDGGDAVTSLGAPVTDTAAKLGANIVAGKLSGAVVVKANKDVVESDDGWMEYNMGAAVLRFKTTGIDNKWSGDVPFFGDSGKNAFTVKIANMAFVSLQNPDGTYVDKELRTIPMMQAGVDMKMGNMGIVGGVAVDMVKYQDKGNGAGGDPDNILQKKATVAGSPVDVEGNSGFLGFAKFSMGLGSMNVGVQANFGKSGNGHWGDLNHKDATAFGVYVPFDISLGGTMSAGVDAGFGMHNKYDGKNNATKIVAKPWFKYGFDENCYVKPRVEFAKRTDDVKAMTSTEIYAFAEVGYSF
jgi:hypothetical protein